MAPSTTEFDAAGSEENENEGAGDADEADEAELVHLVIGVDPEHILGHLLGLLVDVSSDAHGDTYVTRSRTGPTAPADSRSGRTGASRACRGSRTTTLKCGD